MTKLRRLETRRHCAQCGKVFKPVTGRQRWCNKECNRIAYNAAHAERRARQRAAHYVANRERFTAYYVANRARIRRRAAA